MNPGGGLIPLIRLLIVSKCNLRLAKLSHPGAPWPATRMSMEEKEKKALQVQKLKSKKYITDWNQLHDRENVN